MRSKLADLGLGERVEKAWLYWARGFLLAHPDRDPTQLRAGDIQSYVESLARARQSGPEVQRQITRACVFLLRDVLDSSSPELTMLWQSARSRVRPVILTPSEVQALLNELDGASWLMASLSYGAGLRLMECVQLRIRDLRDRRIIVRDSNGRMTRETVLPDRVRDSVRAHLEALKLQHIRELADGFGGVKLPLNANMPASANRSWAWQFLFPGPYMSETSGRGATTLRSHVSPAEIRQAIEQAARMAALDRPVSENTLRNSFAAHLLQRGVAISDVEKLLGVSSSARSKSAGRAEETRFVGDHDRSAAGF